MEAVMACIITTDGTVTFELIEPDVQRLNNIVHGYIEMIPEIIPGHHAYCNEDGKTKKLSVNHFATALAHSHRRLLEDVIVGDVVIFGSHNAPEEGPVTKALLTAMQELTEGIGDVTWPGK